jgi:hypothetical protein
VSRLFHGDIYLPQACTFKVSKAFSSIAYEHTLVSIVTQQTSSKTVAAAQQAMSREFPHRTVGEQTIFRFAHSQPGKML